MLPKTFRLLGIKNVYFDSGDFLAKAGTIVILSVWWGENKKEFDSEFLNLMDMLSKQMINPQRPN